MNDTYLELSIAFNKQNRNIIYNRLYKDNAGSILEEQSHIKVYFPKEQKERLEDLIIKMLLLDGISEKSIIVNEHSDKNWSDAWKNSIEPVYIKKKIIIYPSWKKHILKNTRNKILIEIDPKMSFGTGHNDTTQLILELMCEYIDKNDVKMLDFGCGTSILAIAGIKLGLKSSVAIDVDEDAIKNSKENIRINKVSKNIKLFKKQLKQVKEDNFDIIAANLTSGVILNNLKQIYNKLKPEGKLFATGILNEEKRKVKDALKEYFVVKQTITKAQWAGFYCVKK